MNQSNALKIALTNPALDYEENPKAPGPKVPREEGGECGRKSSKLGGLNSGPYGTSLAKALHSFEHHFHKRRHVAGEDYP